MTLSEILKDIPSGTVEIPDRKIRSIANDSRKATPDSLFIAASGYVEDAHPFIESAYQNGCRNFVLDGNRLNSFREQFPDAFFFPVPDVHQALALAAKNFYSDPSSRMKLVGITGTSGKTTTAFAVFSLLRLLGKSAGLVGTIEYRINEEIIRENPFQWRRPHRDRIAAFVGNQRQPPAVGMRHVPGAPR